MEVYPPMTVEYHRADGRGWPEPALDQSWDEVTKLRWKAGVVLAETGVSVTVVTNSSLRKNLLGHWKPERGVFSLGIGNSSHSAYTYREAWDFLNGVAAGAAAAKVAT